MRPNAEVLKQTIFKGHMENIMAMAPTEAVRAYQQANLNHTQRRGGVTEEPEMSQILDVFKEFADANNTRLNQIEARIDGNQAISNRAGLYSGGSSVSTEDINNLRAFVRMGEIRNVMSEGSSADGGYTLPTQIDSKISEIQLNLNPMRRVADVITVSTPNFSRLANIRGTASGWVGETTARPVTNSLQFASLTPFWGELYAMPKATQQLLDDAGFDIETFITKNIGEQFAAAEGTAFTTGDGATKPKGFLAYPTANTADGVRAFGTLQYIPTTVAADFAATNPADQLMDMVYSLKAAHRPGACWMMSKSILNKIRRFKTTTGEYLWTDSTAGDGGIAGAAPGTLLGYPVYENEDMATAVGAGSLIAAFGNFKNGYAIVDRMGTRLLRDNYTDKPYVNFYCTKRVGGMLLDSEAIRVLKCSVS